MTLYELCENPGDIRTADVFVPCDAPVFHSLKLQDQKTVGTYFSSSQMTPARSHQRRADTFEPRAL